MTRIHFDGEPSTFKAMRDLCNGVTARPKVRWSQPVDRKFRWSRLQAKAERMVWKIRRSRRAA